MSVKEVFEMQIVGLHNALLGLYAEVYALVTLPTKSISQYDFTAWPSI